MKSEEKSDSVVLLLCWSNSETTESLFYSNFILQKVDESVVKRNKIKLILKRDKFSSAAKRNKIMLE